MADLPLGRTQKANPSLARGGVDRSSSEDDIPSPFVRSAVTHTDALVNALQSGDLSVSSSDDAVVSSRVISSAQAAAAAIMVETASFPGEEIPMRPQGPGRATWLRESIKTENPYGGPRSLAPRAGDDNDDEVADAVLRATEAAAKVDARKDAAAAPAATPAETPLDSTQVFIIGYVAFVNILNMVIIFPFLPFYTAVFYPDVPASRLGVYVGMLASAYYLGDMCGSLLWGPFADRYGRKPAVNIGLLSTMVGILLFAIAPSYRFALTVRVLSGFLCGNNALTRTLMSEACDDSNQGRGFSMIGLSTGLARLFAPAIGGILALPATKYPDLFRGTIFERFPYLLPCLVGAVLTGSGLVMVTGWLNETLDRDAVEKAARTKAKAAGTGNVTQVEDESLLQIVMQPTVLNVILGYFLHSFVGVISHEIVPVWVINSKADHGFEMETSEIGLLLSLVAPFQVIFQAWIYPELSKKWKFIKLFRVCVVVYGGILFVQPCMAYLNMHPRWVVWPVFICAIAVTMCSRIGAFTCISVMVSNSCTKSVRGSINGVAQAASSAGRMLGPTVAGAIFAWSMNNGLPFPFNFHLIFIVLTLVCAFSYGMSLLFDPALDSQKPESSAMVPAPGPLKLAAGHRAGGALGQGRVAAASDDEDEEGGDDADSGLLVRKVDFGAALGVNR